MKDNLELLHDRYARALFLCAEEDKTVDRAMEELMILSTEWLEDRKFVLFLTHPLISPDEKKTVIEKLLRRKRCCKTILNFLKVLIDNHRENLIHAVFLRYRDLYNQFKGRIRVYVETPRLFTKEEKYFLKDILTLKFKEEISVEVKENPDLIGGIFMKLEDRIYDYSVRSHLNNLKKILSF